jgi:dihydroflavonol-4-reductase
MILVTGASGLLGKVLVQMLAANGKKVKAAFNNTAITAASSPNIIPIKLDILDVYELEDALENVTEVYHCAGLVSFLPKDEKKLYKINVEGTANVVNACLNAGIRKLVHVSSVAALGRIRPGQAINETMQWTDDTSNSKYGHSKYLGELEVWRAVAEGLNAAVVNPVIILGAGNWNEGSTKLFKSVYEGFPWYSTGTTGFVDVKDVASAMMMLMDSEVASEKFILSAENCTYQSLLNMIAKGFDKKMPSKKVTPFLAAFTWRVEAIKSLFTGNAPLITRETAATSLAEVQFENSKFLKAFPEFKYTKLEDSVTDICKALKQDMKL